MIMKWYIFREMKLAGIFCILLLGLGSCPVSAAERWEGKKLNEKHEKKLERYKKGWESLIPRYEKIQYAGSMGLISVGAGWDYGRKKQWETDLFLGYLPRFDGDHGHVTITLKENYIPWKLPILRSKWMVEPFTVSLYMNKIFGREFWTREPDKYPDGYYGLATNLRFNLAFGQRINFKINPIGLSDQLTFFYEFATNDLYIISYFCNRYLKIPDLFSLSLGIKFQFM